MDHMKLMAEQVIKAAEEREKTFKEFNANSTTAVLMSAVMAADLDTPEEQALKALIEAAFTYGFDKGAAYAAMAVFIHVMDGIKKLEDADIQGHS